MADTAHPSFLPTPGLSYDPTESRYWDRAALDGEVERAFAICHGCRMCFKYCDSFPLLFSALDERHDGDVRQVTAAETAEVMDACFQCKLCEVQCPYTPRDGHEFQLDFPKLVHRYKAQRTDREGLARRDQLFVEPDRVGRAARASRGLADSLNRVKAHRLLMERLFGVHRDKTLPPFARESFEQWAEAEGLVSDDPAEGEVVLFQTCYVQNNEPQIGRDTVDVLRANAVPVTCEKGLDCCGMPAWERGDLARLRRHAQTNVDKLLPHVEAGKKVLAINPTCSMMLRRDYPELVDRGERERAQRVADAVMDPAEFLWSIRREDRFNTEFRSTPGPKVAYHAPCHLRAQAVGFKGRDLIRKIPGVAVATTMECCGHDGTFAMTVEGFEASVRIGRKAFDEMGAAGAEVWATDCPLAAIQFGQHAERQPLHPMTILARAYRPDGFPTPLPQEPDDADGSA